jgi:hypothetical protein
MKAAKTDGKSFRSMLKNVGVATWVCLWTFLIGINKIWILCSGRLLPVSTFKRQSSRPISLATRRESRNWSRAKGRDHDDGIQDRAQQEKKA